MFHAAASRRFTIVAIALLLSKAPPAIGQTFPEVERLPARSELPDPLKMFDGTSVATREQWRTQRRPELKALFQHYMYGNMPPAPTNLRAHVERTEPGCLGGKAKLREITLEFGPPGTPPIHLLLVTPNGRKERAPVFVGPNFCGNHAALDDPQIALPTVWMPKHCKGCQENRATAAGRGADVDVWCIENAIDRGYAIATFYCGDVDPDLPDFNDGVHPHYFQPGQKEPGEHDWGSIAAWAWGVHRAVDYLTTDNEIDPRRIAAIGHSRLGKTVLLAGAFDERIALVVPHQSGTGGCALSRKNNQETIERINRVFPHWFNDTFPKFDGKEDLLPIDQHLLIALVAPRPLLDTEGSRDTWANFDSAYKALQGADVVYRFLGSKGLVAGGLVQGDEPIGGPKFSELMQYRRDAAHVLNKDFWNVILDFADKHFSKN